MMEMLNQTFSCRVLEIPEAIKIIRQAIDQFPEGKITNRSWDMEDTPITKSYIEVPRGKLYHSYCFDDGRVRNSIIRTPSITNIGAMQYAAVGSPYYRCTVCYCAMRSLFHLHGSGNSNNQNIKGDHDDIQINSLIAVIGTLIVAFLVSVWLPGIERKFVQARIQQRVGPPISSAGIMAPIKFFFKETIKPNSPMPKLYNALPIVSFLSVLFILLIINASTLCICCIHKYNSH